VAPTRKKVDVFVSRSPSRRRPQRRPRRRCRRRFDPRGRRGRGDVFRRVPTHWPATSYVSERRRGGHAV